MTPSSIRRGQPGFISYVLVLMTGTILTLLMVLTYNRAMDARAIQKTVQLRADYSEKEDAILRSIVAITPNRAIRAMKTNSANNKTTWKLAWQDIFTEALDQANARTSIPSNVLTSLNLTNVKLGNLGDSTLATPSVIFKAITPPGATQPETTDYVSVGNNRTLSGYPPALTTSNATNELDKKYPIIAAAWASSAAASATTVSANDKSYGAWAQSGVGLAVNPNWKFNLLRYPQINFGYARPGDWFVAKRNWWAFALDVAAQDAAVTRLARPGRDLVLSIYEVPSQLAISAASFMALGQFASGDAWQNVNIAGGVFAGRATVESGATAFSALASRRNMTLSPESTINDLTADEKGSPFSPGARELYQKNHQQGNTDSFLPVSLASESGRVAFVPINRGVEFFDRFHANVRTAESNVLAPTTWNSYSVGALQCSMRLDITQVKAGSQTPSNLRFSYLKGGVRIDPPLEIPLDPLPASSTVLPGDYLKCCVENETYDFGTSVVDVAYGKPGGFAYITGVTGVVTFNNARFNDPLVGTIKNGYVRPSYVWSKYSLPSGKPCVAVYPQRLAQMLVALQADGPAVNNSLVVNVDYTSTGANPPRAPEIDPNSATPCAEADPGVVLLECADLRSLTKGFSLVTNLRTYIGEDFNVVQYDEGTVPKPAGYTPAAGQYFPPCSLFAPEKRYGALVDAFAVNLSGQVGSLAKVDKVNIADAEPKMVRPLDAKNLSGNVIGSNRIFVNLRPILHPCELPPIYMMNWLVVLEERRKEFVGN